MTDKDERPWIKLSIDYLDNPKIDALSDSAILLHLSLLLKAGQQKQDGKVSARACKARGEAPLKELVKQKLLIKLDPLSYQIHDYVKHQTRAEIITKRATAGAKGGHKKNHEKRLVFVDTCEHCLDAFQSAEKWLEHPELVGKTG